MNRVNTISLILITILTSCNSPKPNNSVQVIPELSHSEDLENVVIDDDPYFIEIAGITSTFGPRSITRNIIQDRNGIIWLASWEGIISYDGSTFTNYTNRDSLRKFHVFSVFEDSSGNIWFGTIGAGIYRYDGVTFTNYTTGDGLVNDSVCCFYEDNDRHLWIGTQGGLSVFDGLNFTNYTTSDGLADNDTNSIVADNNGVIWIGSRGMASKYDGISFSKIITNHGQVFNNVRTIVNTSDGHMWLGGNDGLWKYNGSEFTNYTKDFVGFIYEDSQGRIWTSSEIGDGSKKWALSRYDVMAINSPLVEPVTILQKEDMFFGIAEDADGGLWLGSLNGVSRYDGVSFDYFID